jgi:hypothetical protein
MTKRRKSARKNSGKARKGARSTGRRTRGRTKSAARRRRGTAAKKQGAQQKQGSWGLFGF